MTTGDAHQLSVYLLPLQLVIVICGKDLTCRLIGVSLTCEAIFRISTLSEVLNDSAREVENSILSFIQSSFNALEGPNHFWLNKVEADNDCLGRVKTFLVLLGQFDANSPSMRYQAVKTLRTMKSIKQRSPHVYVMIFQFGSSAGSSLYQTHLAELMIKEHVNFPVLFTSENFSEITNEPCFFLYKEFKNPVVFLEKDADVEMIEKAIEDFDKLDKEDSEPPVRSKSPLFKQNDIAKEPCLSSIVQNLLIYFPGCVTADEDGSRLFLSDSNHHRIIICDGSGKILDCVCMEFVLNYKYLDSPLVFGVEHVHISYIIVMAWTFSAKQAFI